MTTSKALLIGLIIWAVSRLIIVLTNWYYQNEEAKRTLEYKRMMIESTAQTQKAMIEAMRVARESVQDIIQETRRE